MLNGNSKLSDLVYANPRLLLVLEHFNIPLGIGEQTVHEVCEKYRLNEHLFLTIANLYCCKDSVTIHVQDFDRQDAHQILDFLKSSHVYFLDEKFPKLKSLIQQKIDRSSGEKYSLLIKKFLNDYSGEVYEHINYENTIVFPYIESVLQGSPKNKKYSLHKVRKHHTNIQDKLTDLKNLLFKYVPPDYDSVIRRRMLFELFDLEQDINIHLFIEDHILIPLVERLEAKVNG